MANSDEDNLNRFFNAPPGTFDTAQFSQYLSFIYHRYQIEFQVNPRIRYLPCTGPQCQLTQNHSEMELWSLPRCFQDHKMCKDCLITTIVSQVVIDPQQLRCPNCPDGQVIPYEEYKDYCERDMLQKALDEFYKRPCEQGDKCKNGGRNNKKDMIFFKSCDHYVCFTCYADVIEPALMSLYDALQTPENMLPQIPVIAFGWVNPQCNKDTTTLRYNQVQTIYEQTAQNSPNYQRVLSIISDIGPLYNKPINFVKCKSCGVILKHILKENFKCEKCQNCVTCGKEWHPTLTCSEFKEKCTYRVDEFGEMPATDTSEEADQFRLASSFVNSLKDDANVKVQRLCLIKNEHDKETFENEWNRSQLQIKQMFLNSITEEAFAQLKLEGLKRDADLNAFRFDKVLNQHQNTNVWVADVAFYAHVGIVQVQQFPPPNLNQMGAAITVFDDGTYYYCVEPKHVRLKWVIKL